MIKAKSNIIEVKQKVKGLLGRSVIVKVNLGRNKFESFKGKVAEVYPALFKINPTGVYRGKTTYSFQEMLCGTVHLKLDEQSL